MDFDKAMVLAENIYFAVVDELGIEDECIELDGDGTKNTEKGEGLYATIEYILLEGDFQ